jgi:hypothetical protein
MAQRDFKNCFSSPQSDTLTHNQTFEVGNTVTKTKTVTTGLSIMVGIKGKVDVGISGAEANTQITFNLSTAITDSEQVNLKQSKTEQYSQPIAVPSYSVVHASHAFIQYLAPIGYSGSVVLDGPIIPNEDGLALLSQVFPDEKDRTFSFSGVVENGDLVVGVPDLLCRWKS